MIEEYLKLKKEIEDKCISIINVYNDLKRDEEKNDKYEINFEYRFNNFAINENIIQILYYCGIRSYEHFDVKINLFENWTPKEIAENLYNKYIKNKKLSFERQEKEKIKREKEEYLRLKKKFENE